MGFPLLSQDYTGSIFARIAANVEQNSQSRPALSAIYDFVPKAIELLGLSCGTLDEFARRVFPICVKDLSKSEIAKSNRALAHLLKQHEHSPTNLEESLKLKGRPQLRDIFSLIKQFQKLLNLKDGTDCLEICKFHCKYYQSEKNNEFDDELFGQYLSKVMPEVKNVINQFENDKDPVHKTEEATDRCIKCLDKFMKSMDIENLKIKINKLAKSSDDSAKCLQNACNCILLQTEFYFELKNYIELAKFNVAESSGKKTTAQTQQILNQKFDGSISYVNCESISFFYKRLLNKLDSLFAKLSLKFDFEYKDSSELLKKNFKVPLSELDDLGEEIKNLLKEVEKSGEEKLDKRNKLVIFERIALFKSFFKFKEFFNITFAKLALRIPSYSNADVLAPVLHHFLMFSFNRERESDNTGRQLLQFYMLSALEKFTLYYESKRNFHYDLYRFCYSNLTEIIEKRDSKKTNLHYLRFDSSKITQHNLPRPDQIDNFFSEKFWVLDPHLDKKIASFDPFKTPKTKNRFRRSYKIVDECYKKEKQQNYETEVQKKVDSRDIDTINIYQMRSLFGAESFKFLYHERVYRWFDAKSPLDYETFPEYSTSNPHYQSEMISKHAFSFLSDLFSHKCIAVPNDSSTSDVQRFFLPATLVTQYKKERGCVLWAVANKVCFHRFFHVKSNEEIISMAIKKRFESVDFPQLPIHSQTPTENYRNFVDDVEEEIEINDFMNTISFTKKNPMSKLTLFLEEQAESAGSV